MEVWLPVEKQLMNKRFLFYGSRILEQRDVSNADSSRGRAATLDRTSIRVTFFTPFFLLVPIKGLLRDTSSNKRFQFL